MATEEEIYKFVIKVENEEKLKTTAAAAALAEQKFKALFDSLGSGHPQTKAAAAAFVDLNKQLEAGKAANRNLGQATLEASRGLEDLQYGVAGVLNNIPSLIASLGGSAGLAGVVSLVAVGGKVLYDHWDDLAGLFGMGATKSEAEQMEELGKKTSKTADETARLLKYEEGRKHLEAQGKKPEATTKFGQAVDKAISEGPASEVDRGLDKHFGDRIRTMAQLDPRVKEADDLVAYHQRNMDLVKKNGGPGADPDSQLSKDLGAAIAARDALYGEARNQFRAGLADPANAGTTRAVAAAARKNPRDFGPDGEQFADSLDAALDPQAGQRKKIGDAFGKIVDKIAEKLPKLAQEAQKKIDQAAKKAKEAEDKEQEFWDREDERTTNHKVQWQEKNRQDDEEKARKLAEQRATTGTGLNAQGEQAMMRSMLAGGSREEVTKRVADAMAAKFERDGVDPGRAREMASEKAEGLFGSVGDDISERAMKGPKDEPHPVERIGIGDFARSVESAGAKKMETLTEEMKNVLVEIRTNTRNINRVGP